MKINNPLLQQAVQAVESKVDPALRNSYDRIVLAGEKFMFSDQTRKMLMNQLKSTQNPAEAAGEGIAKLFVILMRESKGTLNMKVAIFAMTTLLCVALDFMEEAGYVKVTTEVLARATEEMGSAILQIQGATPDKIAGMVQQRGAQPQGLVNNAMEG